MRRGIPTRYAGLTFRSRTEARWAVMFDQMGWRWEYEPIDLDGYIPDFVLMFHQPLLVEVKHEFSTSALARYCRKIEMSGWEHEALILGASPELDGPDCQSWGAACFGLLGERVSEDLGDIPTAWCWDDAYPFHCLACRRTSLLHTSYSWTCRVNGCYEGDGHIAPLELPLMEAWRMAHEATAWRGVA